MSRRFFYSVNKPMVLSKVADSAMKYQLGVGKVRAKTLFSAISPGTEIAAYEGMQPLRKSTVRFPRLVGYCNVAEIIEVSENASGLLPGQLILTHSSHRTHFEINTHEVLCLLNEKDILPEFSTAYLFHLAYNAVLESNICAGMKVGIVGLGTLGLTSASLSNFSGASVTAFSDMTDIDFDTDVFGIQNLRKKTFDNTDSSGNFDVVILTSNSWLDYELALKLLRVRGILAVLGFPGRNEPLPERNPLSSDLFYDKQLTLKACGLSPNYEIPEQHIRFTLKRNLAFLISLIRRRALPARDLIEGIVSAHELENIYNKMRTARKSGKTYVLDWSDV